MADASRALAVSDRVLRRIDAQGAGFLGAAEGGDSGGLGQRRGLDRDDDLTDCAGLWRRFCHRGL